jgi:mRNA interferase RelE/StbE
MKIYQSGIFARKVKKLTNLEKTELDSVVKEIASRPTLSAEKKGDLKGVLIYKFKLQKTEYLLAYRVIVEQAIELIMIGPHENYYRDLKNYIKNKKE